MTGEAIDVLPASIGRLRTLVEPLDEAALDMPAYPAEWTIADVLSHLGSSAVIMQRRLDDGLAGQATPDDFAPSVWDAWNAKTAPAKAADTLVADAELLARLESISAAERERFSLALGPLTFDFDEFVGLRVNEHAMHTWDIEVALDPTAGIPPEATAFVVDNLDLVARFTAKPIGDARRIAVRTTRPERAFTIELTADTVTMSAGTGSSRANLEMPAEAFARLIYGRLDPDHTPTGLRTDELGLLRQVYLGP